MERTWTKEEIERLAPEVNGFEDFPMTENESEVFGLLLQTRLDLETAKEQSEFKTFMDLKGKLINANAEITRLRGALERSYQLQPDYGNRP